MITHIVTLFETFFAGFALAISRCIVFGDAAIGETEHENLGPPLFHRVSTTFMDRFDQAREAFKELLNRTVAPPLRDFHEPIDAWLGSLPMSVATCCAVGLFVAAIIWVWTIKRNFIMRGAPDESRWRDLRIWATIVCLPYIAVYLLLGR